VPLSVRIGDDFHRCRSCLGLRIRARASAKERNTRRLDENDASSSSWGLWSRFGWCFMDIPDLLTSDVALLDISN